MSLVIVGAGGHAREVHDITVALDIECAGFLAESVPDPVSLAERGPWLGGLEHLPSWKGMEYVIAVGSGSARLELARAADGAGLRPTILIHPTAVVGGFRVTIGEGAVLAAYSIVTTDVVIGRHVQINRASQVGHDCDVGDFATLHPGAILSGNAALGEGVTMGTHSCTRPGVTVGAWAEVGAGAVVVDDLPAGITAVGIPARDIRSKRSQS